MKNSSSGTPAELKVVTPVARANSAASQIYTKAIMGCRLKVKRWRVRGDHHRSVPESSAEIRATGS